MIGLIVRRPKPRRVARLRRALIRLVGASRDVVGALATSGAGRDRPGGDDGCAVSHDSAMFADDDRCDMAGDAETDGVTLADGDDDGSSDDIDDEVFDIDGGT